MLQFLSVVVEEKHLDVHLVICSVDGLAILQQLVVQNEQRIFAQIAFVNAFHFVRSPTLQRESQSFVDLGER